jgi:CheY-like chemotaxis protein/HAMP domain-containing protein
MQERQCAISRSGINRTSSHFVFDLPRRSPRGLREVGPEGKLGGQADIKGASGVWNDLTDDVNFVASNLTTKVRGIVKVVTAVANGELKQKLVVHSRSEVGARAVTINNMTDTLSTFAEQVSTVAREVGAEGKLGRRETLVSSDGAGKNTEFEACLPITTDSQGEATVTGRGAPAPVGARVLIVEDDEDSAEALMMLLEQFGQTVKVVHDGPSGVEAAQGGDFEAVLVDIGLPGIDGYEVARRIRVMPTTRAMILGALTGYGQEKDKQRALAAGFDEHLTKPLKIERLHEFISRVASANPRA